MSVLLQLSDPHFGTERPPVVEALRALCRDLEPRLVVLSGDITQRARRRQFRAAREYVATLGSRSLLAIPGNHDIPLFDLATRALNPYREHRRAFGDDLEPEFESPELLVLCVNTTRAYRHKHGEVSAAQIERVARRLRGASSAQLRIVVTHQPAAVARAVDEPNLLRGGERAARAWAESGADLILGGHIHLPYVLALHERFGDWPRRLWVVQAGTALSGRVRHEADNSVNVVRSGAGTATVERWDYGEDSRRFALHSKDELVLDRGAR
jgi:3',5'-cyclic AMP phosphodiesterase CpdA